MAQRGRCRSAGPRRRAIGSTMIVRCLRVKCFDNALLTTGSLLPVGERLDRCFNTVGDGPDCRRTR